ncbi:unnamed protein product, partial [Meganyctiphanes norvegica]
DREWEVNEGKHITIPLGRDVIDKSFPVKIYSYHDYRAVIRIFNSSKRLLSREYNLMVKKNEVILKSLKDQQESITFEVSQNLTTIAIFSEGGNFNVTVSFETQPTSTLNTTPIPVTTEENCPNCHDTSYIVGFSCILLIFVLITCIVGLGFNSRSLQSRTEIFKNCKRKKEDNVIRLPRIDANGNCENYPLNSQENRQGQ